MPSKVSREKMRKKDERGIVHVSAQKMRGFQRAAGVYIGESVASDPLTRRVPTSPDLCIHFDRISTAFPRSRNRLEPCGDLCRLCFFLFSSCMQEVSSCTLETLTANRICRCTSVHAIVRSHISRMWTPSVLLRFLLSRKFLAILSCRKISTNAND